MQLTLDFTPVPKPRIKPILKNTTWLDVSEAARMVGFATPLEISLALSDALAPLQTETEADYDQRLFDALWLAHFQLTLDPRPSVAFTFTFPRKDGSGSEVTLRLRVEVQKQIVLLGLSQDF